MTFRVRLRRFWAPNASETGNHGGRQGHLTRQLAWKRLVRVVTALTASVRTTTLAFFHATVNHALVAGLAAAPIVAAPLCGARKQTHSACPDTTSQGKGRVGKRSAAALRVKWGSTPRPMAPARAMSARPVAQRMRLGPRARTPAWCRRGFRAMPAMVIAPRP